MAVSEGENDFRNRYQWIWTVDKIEKVDDHDKDGNPISSEPPVQEGDRIFLFFVSEYEVCFHKRAKKGFINNDPWEQVRGIFSPKSRNICGELDLGNDRTIFELSLEIDQQTGAGCIKGRHFFNPSTHTWFGHD